MQAFSCVLKSIYTKKENLLKRRYVPVLMYRVLLIPIIITNLFYHVWVILSNIINFNSPCNEHIFCFPLNKSKAANAIGICDLSNIFFTEYTPSSSHKDLKYFQIYLSSPQRIWLPLSQKWYAHFWFAARQMYKISWQRPIRIFLYILIIKSVLLE